MTGSDIIVLTGGGSSARDKVIGGYINRADISQVIGRGVTPSPRILTQCKSVRERVSRVI